MKVKIFFLLLCLGCWGKQIHAQPHRSTLEVKDWQPPAGEQGAGVASFTLKWELQGGEEQVTASFNLQWYLGAQYYLAKDSFPLEKLPPEDRGMISISQLVMEAEVWEGEKIRALMRFDLGAPPPHGGTWGPKVVRQGEWTQLFQPLEETEAAEQVNWEKSLRDAFQENIQLKNLRVHQLSFGGLPQVEARIEAFRQADALERKTQEGSLAFEAGDFSDAIRHWQAALEIKPEAFELKGDIRKARYYLWLHRGDSARKAEDWEYARQAYEQAEIILPLETAHRAPLEAIKNKIVQQGRYQELLTGLRSRYAEEKQHAEKEKNRYLLAAAYADESRAESCLLLMADYQQCQLDFLDQKITHAEFEARYQIYQDPLDRLKAELPNLCQRPFCDPRELQKEDNKLTARQLLQIARRKYQQFEKNEDPNFMQASRDRLEKALEQDSTLAEAYLLKAYFAADVIEQLAEVEKALNLQPELLEAQEEAESLRTAFVEELFSKIQKGEVSYVERAKNKGLLEEMPSFEGKSPIDQALTHDQAQILALLMQTRLRPKGAIPTLEQALLNRAAHDNKPASARYLLSQGAQPDWLGEDGQSPLTTATAQNAEEVIRIFLQAQPQLKLDAAAQLSTQKGNANLLNLFMEAGASPDQVNDLGDNLLMMAIQFEHYHLIDALLESGVDVNHQNQQGFTALAYAAQKKAVTVLHKLLDYKADYENSLRLLFEKEDSSASWFVLQLAEYALEWNREGMISKLIPFDNALPRRTHSSGRPFLYVTLEEQKNAAAMEMLSSTLDFNEPLEGQAILLKAIESRADSFAIRLIEDKEVNLKLKNDQGENPLHLAVQAGKLSLVRVLLDHHHPINEVDELGRTALHLALNGKKSEVASMLLEKGADVQKADQRNWYPLHLAAQAGKVDLVKQILALGADVNQAGESGMTALHYAAQNNDYVLARSLLDLGASKEKEDFFERTAYKIAREEKNKKLAKLLK
jgi:ankyrin repeat protein